MAAATSGCRRRRNVLKSHSDRPPVYVGVSGVTTAEQAQAILDMWPASAPPWSLMIGVLTSQKVMTGGERNARSAAPKDFASIFSRDYRVLGLVHYFTKDTSDLGEQLLHAAAWGGVGCDGVQVNVPWPPPEELEHFRHYGEAWDRVVLQIGPAALRDTMNPARINGAIAAYVHNNLITDVLLDVSGGGGRPIDPSFAAEMAHRVREVFPALGVGIAGRLTAASLPAVAEIVLRYGLSIDTESGVRNDRDELDFDEVQAYLNAAAWMWGWA